MPDSCLEELHHHTERLETEVDLLEEVLAEEEPRVDLDDEPLESQIEEDLMA
jgi:hypothetical protein